MWCFFTKTELEKCASGCWLLRAISILPEFRGKGYAKHLLKKVEEVAKSTGIDKIALQVEDQNTVAYVFYEKSNYREVDRRPSIPFLGSQDSGDNILMSKRLHYLNDNLSKC